MDHVLGSRSLFAIPHLCTTSLFIAISTSIDPEAFFKMLENSLHYVWTKRICPISLLTKKCLRLGCLLPKSILSWKWIKNINISQCTSPSWFVLAASSSGFTQVLIYAQQFIQEECTNSFIVSLHYELPLKRGTLISLKKPEDTIQILLTWPSCFFHRVVRFRKPFQFLISKNTEGQATCFFVFANRLSCFGAKQN